MLSESRISEADNAAYFIAHDFYPDDRHLMDDLHSDLIEYLFVTCDDEMPFSILTAYARNRARNCYQQGNREANHINELLTKTEADNPQDDNFFGIDDLPMPGQNPEDAVISRETITEILTGYNDLTPMQKKAISLYAEGYKPEEAMIKLERTHNTYYHRIAQAKTKLKKLPSVIEWQKKLVIIHAYEGTHPTPRNWEWRTPAAAFDSYAAYQAREKAKPDYAAKKTARNKAAYAAQKAAKKATEGKF